jgi:hypothetical protein
VKTIVEKSTNLSKYMLDDAEAVALNANDIVIGNPVDFIISDLNASTVTVYEGVTAPADWIGNKYTFDGTEWTLNPEWVDPAALTEETPS